jgi:hypothetical protein
MKNRILLVSRFLMAASLTAVLSGCASPQATPHEKPPHERGWIGGEFREGKAPATGTNRQDGIAVRALSPHTPASIAGLQTDDVILQVGAQRVTKLDDFRHIIDLSQPGAALPVKVYRDGATNEYKLTVGRETYQNTGTFGLGFPPIVHYWNLWDPAHGFSVVFAGFDPDLDQRHETGHDKYDRDWRAWLVIFELSKGKTILKQECTPPNSTARIPKTDPQVAMKTN